MPAKETHLQMIEGIISRMGQNSFTLKGWAITIVSAIFALAAKDTNTRILVAAYIGSVMFWALDSYYLYQERLFRLLFDEVRNIGDDNAINFSMSVKAFISHRTYLNAIGSKTEVGFYVPLLVLTTIGGWVLGAFHWFSH